MIRTRQSFLQRVKERGKHGSSPQKTQDFEWKHLRSNDDDDLMAFSGDEIDSFMLQSTAESCDDLIVGPPIQSHNSAQDAAEALRQDLEDMGYNLDCKSFITKETDSVAIERYQPPRMLKGPTPKKSSVKTPPLPERDIIMTMRSMITTASGTLDAIDESDDQKDSFENEEIAATSKKSSESSHEKLDWAVSDSSNGQAAAEDVDSGSGSSNGDAPTTDRYGQEVAGRSRLAKQKAQAVKNWNTDDVVSSLSVRRSGSEPSPSPPSYSYGSLKKITTVRAAQSWNEASLLSTLRRPPSSSDDDEEEVMENKEEPISTVTSTISKSGHSHPTSIASPPVPHTLELPIKKQHKHGDTPKTPVLIEGMNFVKNTTLAPESARNSTLSPRTRLARAKLRRIILEKMEQNQDMEITSAKTAPAKQVSNFFVEETKTRRLYPVVKEDLKVDEAAPAEEVMVDEVALDEEAKGPAEEVKSMTQPLASDEVIMEIKPIINDHIEKDRVEEDVAEVTPPHLIPIETNPIAATTAAAESSPKTKSKKSKKSMAKSKETTVPMVSAAKQKSKSPKSPKKSQKKSPRELKATVNTAEPSRKFRPLSVFRKPSLSPKKTRKPTVKASELVKQPVIAPTLPAIEPSKHNDARDLDIAPSQECAYVGYDIETRDGVEVVAVAKTLPYVAASTPAESKKTPSPRNTSHQSSKAIAERRFERKRGVEAPAPPQTDATPSDVVATNKELKDGQASTSLTPRTEEVDKQEKAHWSVMSFFANPIPQKEKPLSEFTEKADVVHEHGSDAARNTDDKRLGKKLEAEKTDVSEKQPSPSDSRPTEASTMKNINHIVSLDAAKRQGMLENDYVGAATKKEISHDFVAEAESKQKRKSSFRIGFKGFRKTPAVRDAKTPVPTKDRHEIIQDFLDRELRGQEEHSFPSKLDPAKNVDGASLLQDMMIQHSQIPKQLIISKLDDSSCLSTETNKKTSSWHETVASPSALDAAVWDEIADAGLIVERAIEQLEQATKAGDISTKASSTLSGDIEKALLTLKKHADRLGVTETDLLLAVKSTDGGESEAPHKSGKAPTSASLATFSSGVTPLTYGQELFESIKGYFFTK